MVMPLSVGWVVAVVNFRLSPVFGSRLLNAQAGRWKAASNYQDYSIGWGNSPPCGPPSLAKVAGPLQDRPSGEMAEWLKAHAWKACVRETVPWVRIPLSPPVRSCPAGQAIS